MQRAALGYWKKTACGSAVSSPASDPIQSSTRPLSVLFWVIDNNGKPAKEIHHLKCSDCHPLFLKPLDESAKASQLKMRRRPLFLFLLLLAISGWVLWARWPSTLSIAAVEPLALAQTSPQLTPTAIPTATLTPTPTTPPTTLPPMPTPSMTRAVEDDWQSYTSPYLGFSFRYPPGWSVEGPESKAEVYDVSVAVQYVNIIGVPTWLSSSSGDMGTISLILHSYRRLPETSLAEWISLYNDYSSLNSMWGFTPIQLATMPAEDLPEGVDEGIYSIYDLPYNSPKRIWLQRGDFVYSIGSSYNRPKDIALILAVIKSMEFDPTVEATLRQPNRFQGDDETFRQELARVQAELAARLPECDPDCEYIKFMTEVERWKTLPAPERPIVQPIRFDAPDDTWQSYTQPLMGISFRYAPFLEVIDPFEEKKLDERSLFDEIISIRSKGGAGVEAVMTIELFPYTRSDDVPINNWEAIQDQLNRARNPYNQFQYRLIVPIEWNNIGHHVDDMVHTQDQAPYYRIETFWLSKDGVVFRVISSFPAMAGFVPTIISTMEFDRERLAELRASGIFAGDERTMAAELVEAWANPLPTVDPQATPTPIPTGTPRPTWTPTPAIRHTVTPSAFESPLINGLRQYHGRSNSGFQLPYRLLFDPSVWQWSVDPNGSNLLVHRRLEGCELRPGWGAYEVPLLAPAELAGQAWRIHYFTLRDVDDAVALMYATGLEDDYVWVTLYLSEPLPDPYDPENKIQCQLDAEAVLGTFTYQEAPPTPTSTPTTLQPEPLLPTVTPTPVATALP
jgi:hypothetical protein